MDGNSDLDVARETYQSQISHTRTDLASHLIDMAVGIRLTYWEETEHAQFDDHSQAYLPHMDKENGTLMSLNVECIK